MSATGGAEGVEVSHGEFEAARDALTIYPKHPTLEDVYHIRGTWAPASITAKDKRFSDAELAAEVWRSEHD